ncbi:DUF1349 domain-containing protein [Deinococcus radiomollis]|uniref:DUF1349 domain-containing protein n=1 Tax=Deinococcus radiomollis TaxID=468916 RepID=UPI003891240E
MTPWTGLHWLNEPDWSTEDQTLRMTTQGQTDFWRATHYGFVRDSGHVLHTGPLQDFTARVRVEGQYQALYDQAGLMVRSSPAQWVKAGVEFVGEQQLSAVVTRDFSDWNVRPVGHPETVELKMTRCGDTLSVQVRLPGQDWGLLRLAYYPPEIPAVVGVFACSPERAGFQVQFSDFEVGAPEEGALY